MPPPPWIWERPTDDIRVFMGDIRAGVGVGDCASAVTGGHCAGSGDWRYAGCGAGRQRIARRGRRAVGVGCCPFPVAS